MDLTIGRVEFPSGCYYDILNNYICHRKRCGCPRDNLVAVQNRYKEEIRVKTEELRNIKNLLLPVQKAITIAINQGQDDLPLPAIAYTYWLHLELPPEFRTMYNLCLRDDTVWLCKVTADMWTRYNGFKYSN